MGRKLCHYTCKLLIINTLLSHGVWAQELERSQEHVPLTLYQLLARADLVAHVRVKDGAGRYAIVEMVSELKGDAAAAELRIDFRALNLSPHGQELIVFRSEEEYVLLLMRKHWPKPKESRGNIMELLHGRRGKIRLPAEGWGAALETVQTLVPLTRLGPEEQSDRLRSHLLTDNLLLREAVLDELIRLQTAEVDDLPALVHLLSDPSPRIRARDLRLMKQVFEAGHGTNVTDEERNALGMVLERARNDANEEVRIQSVRALGAWCLPAELNADLSAIAKQDPSQSVRYEAERILFRTTRP